MKNEKRQFVVLATIGCRFFVNVLSAVGRGGSRGCSGDCVDGVPFCVLARHALEDVVGGEDSKLAGFTEVGNATFLVSHAQIHQSAVVVGFSEVGLHLNCFGVASDSLGVVLDDYVGVTLVE